MSWKLFDPQIHLSKSILPDNDASRQLSFSADGHIAFSSIENSNTEVYVWNPLWANQTPVNISQDSTAQDYPLGWSPDGHFLAFSSNGENTLLNMWDGKSITNITPENLQGVAVGYTPLWNDEGHLAFILHYSDHTSEIYIWDGISTHNLSQNLNGSPYVLSWSRDGRLAFTLGQDSEYDMFIWDGKSINNGPPAADTFTHVAPGLIGNDSLPTWTTDGHVAFIGHSAEDKNPQIYVWDGEKATNISQNPTMSDSFPVWYSDGRWAFSAVSPSQHMLYVRNLDNRTILTVEAEMSVWSPSGYLLFCLWDQANPILSIWDGQQIIKIEQGDIFTAEWNNGSFIGCSGI